MPSLVSNKKERLAVGLNDFEIGQDRILYKVSWQLI